MIENKVIKNCKPGYQKKRFQKLKKGELHVEFEINLRLKTLSEAENLLNLHLPRMQMQGHLIGLIIHGKGYGSGPEGPKMKNFVAQYLDYNQDVLAYHSAQQKDGGTGAVYIQLKNIN